MERRPRLICRISIALNAVLFILVLHFAHELDFPPASIIYTNVVDRIGSAYESSFYPISATEDKVAISARSCRGLCHADPSLCEAFGEAAIAKSIGYSGTNSRLRRVLAKMRRGEPFNVAVIGGSVSHGHGIHMTDEPYNKMNMHRVIFDHLNATFPSPDGGILRQSGHGVFNGFVNGAQPALGSDYFSMCYKEHIPEDVDLILVELAINDPFNVRSAETFEYLLRSLLNLPKQPAIISIQVFALMFQSIALGGDQFYDVPVLSLRNVVLPLALKNESLLSQYFATTGSSPSVDLRHISPYAHQLTGKLVNAYIDTQLCEMDRLEDAAGTNDIEVLYPLEPIPRIRALQKYDATSEMPLLDPVCNSTNSAIHKLVPYETTGWRQWNWEEKNYLIADVPGSTISFEFSTTIGAIHLFYQRSREFGLGQVSCWVDDDRSHSVTVDGYWTESWNVGRTQTIGFGHKPGHHLLHCELLSTTNDPKGGTEFRIISLMSI